jgi:hypothetical protein
MVAAARGGGGGGGSAGLALSAAGAALALALALLHAQRGGGGGGPPRAMRGVTAWMHGLLAVSDAHAPPAGASSDVAVVLGYALRKCGRGGGEGGDHGAPGRASARRYEACRGLGLGAAGARAPRE